jgi:hypothetical protein
MILAADVLDALRTPNAYLAVSHVRALLEPTKETE